MLPLSPIGTFHTTALQKFAVPHQPSPKSHLTGIIEFRNDPRLIAGLRDLDGFSHIWLLWWFHKVTSWKSSVLPPRGPARRRGVFATRSPHRPNPIGISVVPLISIERNIIHVGAHDLIHETPILDIKPYLPRVDSLPDAISGWVEGIDSRSEPRYTVAFSPLAEEQSAWLRERNISFLERAIPILQEDPTPHRTRRIKRSDDHFIMACGAWRVVFSLINTTIYISGIKSGYPESTLAKYPLSEIPDGVILRDYLRRWE
jgi:tRNA (adenine37-N6)-methyltransferase